MSSTALLSYAGWAFLPNLVTGWLQSIFYGIAIRAGDPKPQPGSPRYVKHRRRIHMTVIIVYLLYTLYEADYILRQSGDFYQDLGLAPDVEEKQIKSRFRRLAALQHPDKVPADDPIRHAAAESNFVNLKTAQDTLSDSIKRFAYERFGPDMLKYQHCKTIRDYLVAGIQASSLPLYAGSTLMLALLSLTNYLQWGRFWRYLTLAGLFLLEYHTITRPYPSPLLTTVFNPILSRLTVHPPLLPFQLLALARKATFTLFIAFSQLGNLFPQGKPGPTTTTSPHDLQQLMRLEGIAKASEIESSRLLAMDMAPFAGDEQGTNELRGRVKEWLVNNTIRADPEVRDAMGRALAGRRRSGAPVGARIS
ncbi:MAG: hypothetical protein ASARMPRED_004304 [Alectoria sarmentosa]|nr:MAG: hypothetical protein ASARMPRED_004304 [Alectoria sarmentosa]